jgi:DnaJ-class molecular chaperone
MKCSACSGTRFEIFYIPTKIYKCGTIRMARTCQKCSGTGETEPMQKMIAAGDK